MKLLLPPTINSLLPHVPSELTVDAAKLLLDEMALCFVPAFVTATGNGKTKLIDEQWQIGWRQKELGGADVGVRYLGWKDVVGAYPLKKPLSPKQGWHASSSYAVQEMVVIKSRDRHDLIGGALIRHDVHQLLTFTEDVDQ